MPVGAIKQDKIKEHPNVKARILPHNDEAEEALLCCALIDEDAPITILNELKPDDFYQNAHKEIFGAMLSLSYKDKPIDFVTLVQELDDQGLMVTLGVIT